MRHCRRWLASIAWAALLCGCSLLVDLDRFDRGGSRADASPTDTGAAKAGDDATSASDGGGGRDATPGDDGGGPIDSGNDAMMVCNQEKEPNDTAGTASTLVVGQNCGMMDPSDEDYWAWTQPGPGSITTSATGNDIEFHITGPGTTVDQVGGGSSTPIGTGTWQIRVLPHDFVATVHYTITRN